MTEIMVKKRVNFVDMLTRKNKTNFVILIIEIVFFLSLFFFNKKNGLKLLVFQSITVFFPYVESFFD